MVTVTDHPEQWPCALAVVISGSLTSSGPGNIAGDLSARLGMNAVIYIMAIYQKKSNDGGRANRTPYLSEQLV